VELLNVRQEADVCISRHMILSNKLQPTEPQRHVKQFQILQWPLRQPKPPKTGLHMLKLMVSHFLWPVSVEWDIVVEWVIVVYIYIYLYFIAQSRRVAEDGCIIIQPDRLLTSRGALSRWSCSQRSVRRYVHNLWENGRPEQSQYIPHCEGDKTS